MQSTCYCETQNDSATILANYLNHKSDGMITNEKRLGFGDSNGHFELKLYLSNVRVRETMVSVPVITKHKSCILFLRIFFNNEKVYLMLMLR